MYAKMSGNFTISSLYQIMRNRKWLGQFTFWIEAKSFR